MHNLKAHDNRQLLSMGTRAFSFLGMSLLIFEEQSEVFRGIASFWYEAQLSMVKPEAPAASL